MDINRHLQSLCDSPFVLEGALTPINEKQHVLPIHRQCMGSQDHMYTQLSAQVAQLLIALCHPVLYFI